MKKFISLLICAFIIIAAAVPVIASAAVDEPVAGDINGDNEANNKDVVTLFRYVSASNKVEDESIYDFNGDTEVNNKDVVALFRYLSSAAETGETGETEPDESETEPDESETEPDETEEEIVVPDKTLTYVPADVYADAATAQRWGFKTATNNLLSKWFADKVELDPETWDPIAPAGFASVSEFVVRRAQGQYIEEITVLKVKEGGSVEDVVAMAEYRLNKERENMDYRLYDDEDHRNEKMLDTGVVAVVGNFVVYIVTEDTETSLLRAKAYVRDVPGCYAAELYMNIAVEEYVG